MKIISLMILKSSLMEIKHGIKMANDIEKMVRHVSGLMALKYGIKMDYIIEMMVLHVNMLMDP